MSEIPRYTITPVRLSENDIDRTAARWREALGQEAGSPAANGGGLVVGMAVIGALIGALPMLGGKPYAQQAPMALGGIGVLLAFLVVRRVRAGQAALESRIAALRAQPEATAYRLSLAGPHRFLPHDHGVLVVVPLNERQCVVLDLSSVSDDPMHGPVAEALAQGSVPSEWRWVVTAEGAVTEFVLAGALVVPAVSDAAWDGAMLERALDARGAGDVVDLPFSAFA